MLTSISITIDATVDSVQANRKLAVTSSPNSWSTTDWCYLHTLRRSRRGNASEKLVLKRRTADGGGVGVDQKAQRTRYEHSHALLAFMTEVHAVVRIERDG
jgi:hypothetical protein